MLDGGAVQHDRVKMRRPSYTIQNRPGDRFPATGYLLSVAAAFFASATISGGVR